MKPREIFTQATYQKIKHTYCIYPYQKEMPIKELGSFSGEELIYKYTEISRLSKTPTFIALTAIKVLVVVFVPLMIFNFLATLLPINFGDESGWGLMDLLVAIFIVWDGARTYQGITNHYLHLINAEIRRRVEARLATT